MEMVKQTVQQLVDEEITYELEVLRSIDLGTDKHSKAVEDIVKLYRANIEDYKVECEIYNQSQRIENEKKRDEIELEIKRLQSDREHSRFVKVKADTLLTTATIVGLTIGTCWYESKGYIFPAKLLQHVPKIKLFV